MNGILTGHRTLNGKQQDIVGIVMNAAQATINGLYNIFNYFDMIRPENTVTTPPNTIPFELDSELCTPSARSNNTITNPLDVDFCVTVDDDHTGDDLKIANTMMLHASVDWTKENPDQTLPSGAFVDMDDVFYKSQLISLGSSRKHLNDNTVHVTSIIIKDYK